MNTSDSKFSAGSASKSSIETFETTSLSPAGSLSQEPPDSPGLSKQLWERPLSGFPEYWGKWLDSTVVLLATFGLVLLLFSHAGRYFYLAELMVNFQLQLGIMACLLPVALIWRRQWIAAAGTSLVVGLTLANPLQAWLPVMSAANVPPSLRVMSYNVYAGNRNVAEVQRVIEESAPEILVIIEFTPQHLSLVEGLRETFPYQVREPRYHGFGIALLSKWKISRQEIHYLTSDGGKPGLVEPPFLEKDDPCIDAEIAHPTGPVRVIGTHLFNPIESALYPLRNIQLQRLAQLTLSSDGPTLPTVILGDFNCTPWSSFFREFLRSTGLRDSRQGFGYLGSWPAGGDLLSIPIDHILTSADVRVRRRWVGEAGGSDHHSVGAELILPELSSAHRTAE